MTSEEAVTLIKSKKPKSFKDFEDLGFKLKYFSEGCFRTVYEIPKLNLVVKFSNTATYPSSHSDCEIQTYNLIKTNRKYKILRAFLPEIYYYNKRSGITVMKKYRISKVREAAFVIQQICTAIIGNSGDMHFNNIGWENGKCEWQRRYVIIDLGYFDLK